MIYFLLTIFFISLLSIMIMIGRKLRLVKSGRIPMVENGSFEIPYLEEGKNMAIEGIKKYEHLALVFIIKSYVQFVGFLKNTYKTITTTVHYVTIKYGHSDERSEDRSEISRLLGLISNYKKKITEIKHKIKEEEKK